MLTLSPKTYNLPSKTFFLIQQPNLRQNKNSRDYTAIVCGDRSPTQIGQKPSPEKRG
ncbi:MAG: hypothetical protein F6K48_06235 [Okeania sp. SIO3H1]|uniref:hypothetical protein n=1 Tax=Okeania sp. SIO1I7 TaxID=2607772 RepID=UPI0013C68FCF|nr:hypothetical protein [Okeania sp. SIO1I7]NEN88545.1 hypothetical protein [Okeania sp. SIO3H1]NET28298.1 hypothetical protein [Okeania sp. SIO1I7]